MCHVRRDSRGMSNSAQPSPSPSPGSWLTRQMERRSMTVRHLAEAMGVTGKTVYDWRDDRTIISEARVPLLAQLLSTSEIDARRGLGYWVPDENTEPPAMDAEELARIETLLAEAIAELNRLKRKRAG